MTACTYCGRKTWGWLACPSHRDLVALDPFFTHHAIDYDEPAALTPKGKAAGSDKERRYT